MAGRGGRRRTTWTKATRPTPRGRKKGAKDKVPRTWKGALRELAVELAKENPDAIYTAWLRGLKAPAPKSLGYLQLLNVTIDGKDTQAIPIEQVMGFVRSVMNLVTEIVTDREQKLRFVAGIRRMIGERAPGAPVIDAASAPKPD
jgi:hypothetical protein